MIDENFSLVLIKWYNLNKRNLPWRNTVDPYKIWISEIILQQTRVEQGLPYYNKFILNFPNVLMLSQAKEERVLKLWQGLGYYSRARNLHFTSKYITEKLKGEFPKNYTDLIKLRGIGKYTASAISSFAYNEKKAVLDGNVFRVLSRYFGIYDAIDSTLGLKIFEEISFKNLPNKNINTYNQSIMEFGALQCKPVSPNCKKCPLSFKCWAFLNKKISSLPVKKKKIIKKERFLNFLILASDKFIYMEKRIKKDIWKNLYQFPLFEDSNLNFTPPEELIKKSVLLKKTEIKHILTHQKLNVVFWHYNLNKLEKNKKYKIIEIKKIEEYPVPKIIENYIAENLRIHLI
tara:strand:+ start:56 stop:1093 length:1038 start_codon:yes stop_codon:yes gene_type:complete